MPVAPDSRPDASRPVAVVLPGSGSSQDFVRRAFGAPLAEAGFDLVVPAPVPGAAVVAAAASGLDEAVRSHRASVVGGISLGAHVVVRWAAAAGAGRPGGPGLAGLLLALPAWTGPPDATAAASVAAAAEVDRLGTDAALRRARAGGGPDWVVDELAAAWPGYGDQLAATLRATGGSPGPDPGQLGRIAVPVGVAAFRDDPLHPAAVAAQWCALLPRGAVEWLQVGDLAADRAVLGAAAVRAWRRAVGHPG